MSDLNTMRIQDMLTVKDVVARLPVSKSLVYQLVKSGRIRSTRFGSKILIDEDELTRYLDDQSRGITRKEKTPSAKKADGVKVNGVRLW